MFLSLNDFFSDESAAIQVDSSVIDVSEFSDEGDQAFLITQGHELLRIDAKAKYAKEQICKAIDQKADDAKGKIIYDIQERFKSNPESKGGLLKYFHSLGYWDANMERQGLVKPEDSQHMGAAFHWANSYRAALEMQEKLAGSLSPEEIQAKASALSVRALSRIYQACSEKDREDIYRQVADGKKITIKEAEELIRSPEVKLSKAEELLAAARARKEEAERRWEEVKADPNIPSSIDGESNPEYNRAQASPRAAEASVENWETKVAELQAQVDAKEAELTKFKYDEDAQRDTRIKVLTDALTVGVPQATADLNKYIRDAEFYPSDVRRHFDDQIKVLADMCGDYLSRI